MTRLSTTEGDRLTGLNGLLMAGEDGDARQLMERWVDQCAWVFMVEFLTKGSEHPHAKAAWRDYDFASRRYYETYLKGAS